MAPKYDNVIVFGPTGAVGSSVAQEASARGAKVWLAMRDTSKKIADLDESKGSFSRIQADLSDTSSITKAVQESKAKAAFFYLIHGNQDGMKAAVSTMKEAGVEYAVFLSSYTINPDEDLASIPQERFIPKIHARVEESLEQTGLAHTALRPGYFAYNVFNNFLDKTSDPWVVRALEGAGSFPGDCIVPKDIGRIGGAVLVNRPSDKSKEIIYIYGPKLLTMEEQVEVIKRVSGKDIKFEWQNEETYKNTLKERGFPPPIIGYFIKASKDKTPKEDKYPLYSTAKSNIKDYSGHEPTQFEEFVEGYLA